MLFRLIFLTLFLASPAYATDFQSWLSDFKQEALQKGISENTINSALSDMSPIEKVIDLDRKQPEGRLSFAQYRKNVVNQQRIQKGRKLFQQHKKLLTEISTKYGVQPQFIIALWGIETNFGGYTGGFSVTRSLATLAHDGRRSKFFRSELLNALKIQDQGHITNTAMKGSWAGAMGQNQFMPSSFLTFAVDHNNDGKKDIWNTRADVFASTANYLSKSGWKGDQRWGRAVKIPPTLKPDLISSKTTKPLNFWRSQGIDVPAVPGMQASLIQPDGQGTQAFLVYNNFKTTLKWNRSTYFATSVGLLADAISQ